MTLDLTGELAAARVLGIIRGTDTAAAIATGVALLDEGVRVIEVALTTPGALRAIDAIRAAAPAGALVGAGTVLTATDVADVAAAGAHFVVTPAVVESIPEAVRRGLPVAAGALTPTEAYTAVRMGASAVKLFPASLGGPAYLRALRDPFPQLPRRGRRGGPGRDARLPGRRGHRRRRRRPAGGRRRVRRRPRRAARPGARLFGGGDPPADLMTAVDVLTFGESLVSLRTAGPLAVGVP